MDSQKIHAVYDFIMNGIGRVKEGCFILIFLFNEYKLCRWNQVGSVYKCKSEMDRSA